MRVAILSTDSREHDRNYRQAQPGFGAAPEALLRGFAEIGGAEIHVLSCTQHPMLSSPEKLADNIWYHSLHVPKIGWMRTLYQGCIRATRKKLRAIQPDIVHGQGTERDCAISTVFSGFPNVLTIHGNMQAIAELYRSPIGRFHWLAARLEAFALRRTGGVFCNSAYTERLIAPQARKTWRVPNALQELFFTPPRSAAPDSPPVFLSIGMLEPRKRQREILALAGRLWRRGLRFELRFAGTTENRTEYGAAFRRELAEAETAGYARHIGMIPVDRLISELDGASALIHAPTEESFGLVVAEALARNLKLFASATGGVVDIASGVEGVELFPVQDWTALENAIVRWMEAGCPRPATAAAVMRQRYHPEIIARRHVEIYREVLSTTGYEKRKS